MPLSYCVTASEETGAPQYEHLSAAIRAWSQNLASLETSGVFDRSLFWPSETKPAQSAPPGSGSGLDPQWPSLETFTTELSPCSSDGTYYFIRDSDARRIEIYDAREISLPPLGQPNDAALQLLFASWARALAQMPRLQKATLFWNLKIGFPGGIGH